MRLKHSTRQALWAYVFLLVPLVLFAVFRIFPLVQAFRLSFYTWHVNPELRTFVGLSHYFSLLRNRDFLQALTNMGKYFAIAVPGQVVAGLVVALLLNSIRRGRSMYRMIYFFPYITPAVAISWAWSLIFSPHLGIANAILRGLGLPPQPFLTSPRQALPTVAFVVVWQYLGFHTVLFLVALNSIPSELFEAARIDGASGWQLFRFITLPLINPTLLLSIVMATGSPSIGILQLFTQVINLRYYDPGGPLGSTRTIVLYMYQVGFRQFNLGYAAAIAVLLFMIILVITAIQFLIIRRRML